MMEDHIGREMIQRYSEQQVVGACWYAVQTMPRHEKKVSVELAGKDIHCFLPTVLQARQWSDRKKVIVEPLFAGYVFVRINADSEARISLLRTKGVVGLVGTRGIPVPIPEPEITAIQAVLESRTPYRAHGYLIIGQRVRIRGGALDGLEGILQEVKGDQSLVISIELIHRSLAVTISGYDVQPILALNEPSVILSTARY
jgi:transcriptional antiterminator NusG